MFFISGGMSRTRLAFCTGRNPNRHVQSITLFEGKPFGNRYGMTHEFTSFLFDISSHKKREKELMFLISYVFDFQPILSGVSCKGNERRISECHHHSDFFCPGSGKTAVAAVVCVEEQADLVPDLYALMSTTYLEDKHLFFLQVRIFINITKIRICFLCFSKMNIICFIAL